MSFTLKKSNLNFNVYTVPSKPTTAGAENDIAIISSVPMPNWMLSPDKPSGIPRSDGDVWIQYSVKGDTFNALKQNAMMIATISAWQYVEGAWVDREAVSCQNGEWVEWILQLAGDGVDIGAVLGNWIPARGESAATTYGVNNTDGTITFVRNANSSVEGVKSTLPIDWSKYSRMEIVVGAVANGRITFFGPGKIGSDTYPEVSVSMSEVGTYNLDVSTINEEYPLHCYMLYTGTNVTISKITLYP